MEMKVGAPVELVWRNDELSNPPGQRPPSFPDEHRMQSQITELDPPRKLAITWGSTGGVSFELEPKGKDVLLTVIHCRVTERNTLLNVSGGWHMHLDVLAARLAGKEPPPFWEGWSRLKKEYERRLAMQHQVVSREDWRAARLALLKEEKELTRRSDELARQRQELPWVRIDKEYRFDTDDGQASLKDLFKGRSQLLVYHFMFGPDYKAGCPSCSAIADGFNGVAVHLANHDVMLWAVSRAPLSKLQAYKRRMGWSFPWASSFGDDFNFDFDVSFTPEQQRAGIEYNYRREPGLTESGIGEALTKQGEGPVAEIAAGAGTDVATFTRERPGMSSFVREDGVIYHTYSAYARGLDGLWGMYQWLDRAPKGRNEPGVWWRRHDEYKS
jgi:predicted dithiol-disulfide oxidoreductase (DUF899 family)/uncharacterized protein YndB with AHSA1/START domain